MSLMKVYSVKRSQINKMLPFLGYSKRFVADDGPLVIKEDWYTATLPPGMVAEKTKDANGDTRIDFQPHPSVSFSVLHQDCNAVVILKDRINVELPNFPDVYIAIEED